MAVQPPSAAPLWEAQMFCWLAFGEHEALKGDVKRAGILIPAEGKPTIRPRIHPADRRETPLRRPPMGGPMLCWLAFRQHEVLKRAMLRARILIAAEGKPTIPPRIYPADGRENTLRRPPKCFA